MRKPYVTSAFTASYQSRTLHRRLVRVRTGLSDDADAEPEENERIEIVPWPLARLDEAIAQCEDSKSLIALLWLAARRREG